MPGVEGADEPAEHSSVAYSTGVRGASIASRALRRVAFST